MESQLDAIRFQTKKIIKQVEAYKEKYKELKIKKQQLISRAHVAKVSNEMEDKLATFSPGGAVQGFGRAEEKILEQEVKALARKQLSQNSFDDLDKYVNQELEDQI